MIEFLAVLFFFLLIGAFGHSVQQDKKIEELKKNNAQLEINIENNKNIIKSLRQDKAAGEEYIFHKIKAIEEGNHEKFIIPHYSLLDELADNFGHQEAGQKLKEARSQSRKLMRSKTAAIAESGDDSTKELSARLILGAFNAQTDLILAKVKTNNFGELKQEILEAASEINLYATQVSAKISDEYISSRLDELKWAVIVHEIKKEEQEEQRLINQQIREEERARREYEKAQKDAQKEEASLKQAIARAQQQVEQAAEAQKMEYEVKLRELNDKLIEAEAKNKRALSMAQQTKAGHIYIVSNIGSFGENIYKIGMTRRLEPMDRIKELGDASVPFGFDVHAIIYSENAPTLERELHKQMLYLQVNKVNPRKEFFKVELSKIRNILEERGISAHWTMKAQAMEYHESLMIEKDIENNPEFAKKWASHQMTIDPAAYEKEELEAV